MGSRIPSRGPKVGPATRWPWAMLALTGCVSVSATPDTGITPPFNVCHGQDCTAYMQTPAPICNGGACLAESLYSNLVLVVSLSEDSEFAPGQSLAIPYTSLVFSPPGVTCTSPPAPCAQLPGYAIVQGAYTVEPSVQAAMGGLDWNLGNPGLATALPIHVTYRPLWPPGSSGSAAVDATSIGLPLDPIAATVVVETAPSSPPGPGQGPSIGFQANLQPDTPYEATFQPDPPFEQAFPPDVKTVTLMTGTQNDEDSLVPDTTLILSGNSVTGRQIPSFSVYRLPDGLAGWQAYLRDATTLRRLSSLETLGTKTNNCASTPCTVLLPTYHAGLNGDALVGTQLVLAPPSDTALPTYVVGALAGEFIYQQTYPELPTPLTVTGTVTDVGGMNPVEADLYFQVGAAAAGTAIYDIQPTTGLALNPTNFEYLAHTTALIDSTGSATYSLTLPPGVYTVTARPLDQVHEVEMTPAFEVDPAAGATTPQLRVDTLRPVTGSAAVGDGRPMAGALVEAVPVACASGASPYCMPRDYQTTTDAKGNYTLALDPGSYVLRIQPQDGTLFPWVNQPVLVQATSVEVPPVVVPAPVFAGIQLFDPASNPVVGAVVRVYQVPADASPTKPAMEVGRAFTDATGTYEMYLAPSSP
jgi:hypothetical protein